MSKVKRVILSKSVISLLITFSVIAILIFASSPAQALNITVTNPSSGILGNPYTFTVQIDVQNTDDLLPIKHVDLQIFNAALPGTYRADCTNLPLPTAASSTVTRNYTGTFGTIFVSGTSGANWGYGYGYRYGYGYDYTSGTWGTSSFGYGYGYGNNTGPTSITYTITWISPLSWPTGIYNIRVLVYGNGSGTAFTHTDTISFTLNAPTPTPTPTPTPIPTPTPTPMLGTTNVTGIVTTEGRFTQTVMAASADGRCTLTIPKDTVGLTKDLKPLSEISIVEMTEPPTGASIINVLGHIYDLGPDGATFDPPITLTFNYNPDEVPEGTDPVIHYWDADAGAWVPLEGCVVDPVAHTITVQISHFTPFVILAVAVPVSPTPTTPAPTTPTPTTPAPTTPAPTTPAPTTPAPTTPAPTTPTPTPTPTNWGLIIGLIVAAIAVIVLLIYFLWWRRRAV
jgi:hypothetical protein